MGDDKLIVKFWKFHRENAHVYSRLVELSKELKEKGQDKYSIKGLFEILRWKHALHTTGVEFKLANEYTAFYARLIMRHHVELRGFFDVKESAADGMFDHSSAPSAPAPVRTPFRMPVRRGR